MRLSANIVATTNPEAQVYFDNGIGLLYGFNHDEAARYFRRAAELDPRAPMPPVREPHEPERQRDERHRQLVELQRLPLPRARVQPFAELEIG